MAEARSFFVIDFNELSHSETTASAGNFVLSAAGWDLREVRIYFKSEFLKTSEILRRPSTVF